MTDRIKLAIEFFFGEYHERKEETAANLKKDQDEWMDVTCQQEGWLQVAKYKEQANVGDENV